MRIAALALGGLAAVAAPAAHASVEVFVGSNGTGTINKYVNGALVGQIGAQGSTTNDFARGLQLGANGMLYVDRLSGNTVQAYDAATLQPVGSPIAINSNGGTSSGTYSMSRGPDQSSLYVSVMGDNSVQKINTTTGTATNLVGAGAGGLQVPMGTLVVGNTLYVSAFNQGNGSSGSVLQYDATTGAFQGTLIGAGQNGLLGPVSLTLAADGNLLVSGYDSSNILKFSRSGQYVSTFVAPGTGGLQNPAGMVLNADDGDLYVASKADDSVRVYDGTTGAYLGFAVAPGAGGLLGATYLAVEGSANGVSVPEPATASVGLAALALLGLRRRSRGARA
jgi:hypothetical protein